jgi:broad specificity phosphatase PhoE
MGLGREGLKQAPPLAEVIARWTPDLVLHSDLRRTRLLALRAARLAGVECIAAPVWRERNFGDWEGRRWSDIYSQSGDAMEGMIHAPDSFRPGSGETTSELSRRAMDALLGLPKGRLAIITHAGPIACILGMMKGLPVAKWYDLAPLPGGMVALDEAALSPPDFPCRPEGR